MTDEHEILKQAYFVLGVDCGVKASAVKERYRKLASVWHPDRFPAPEAKEYAEAELKKINAARDTLLAHFASGHRDSGPCVCRQEARGARNENAEPPPAPKPDYGSKSKREDTSPPESGPTAAKFSEGQSTKQASRGTSSQASKSGIVDQSDTTSNSMDTGKCGLS